MDDIWVTKDGRRLHVHEMDDPHLLNTIRYIYRMHCATINWYTLCPQPRGDMAQLAFDQEFDALLEADVSVLYSIIDLMKDEADKRGLDWKAHVGLGLRLFAGDHIEAGELKEQKRAQNKV